MRLEFLPLDMISEPRLDVRAWISKERLDELTASIKARGVLTPIRVWEEDGRYEIQDGHRRFLAARQAGLVSIPCIVLVSKEDQNEVDKIHANLCREDLSPLEISRHLHLLKDRYGYDNDGLAVFMGVGEGRIRQLLGLTKLPPEILSALEDKRIGEAAARLLAQVPDEGRRKYLLDYALDGGVTIKTLDSWVRVERSRGVEPPVWNGPPTEQEIAEAQWPLKIQCACCKKHYPANEMISMSMDSECHQIAYRLFKEIRDNLKDEEPTPMDVPEPGPEVDIM
jgi:ParB family chromosome partitioning protein